MTIRVLGFKRAVFTVDHQLRIAPRLLGLRTAFLALFESFGLGIERRQNALAVFQVPTAITVGMNETWLKCLAGEGSCDRIATWPTASPKPNVS